jgi:hypothetical protein
MTLSSNKTELVRHSLVRRRNLTPISVSTRTSKGLTVTKWSVKEVQINDLALK